MFELFEHTADLGLRVRADTLENLLRDAAQGLVAMLIANPDTVQPNESRTITLTASDTSYLLFDWLSELLYAFDSEKLLLTQFDLELDGLALVAHCRGERLDPARHQLEHEVKAITYHGLCVENSAGGWQAEVIVDI